MFFMQKQPLMYTVTVVKDEMYKMRWNMLWNMLWNERFFSFLFRLLVMCFWLGMRNMRSEREHLMRTPSEIDLTLQRRAQLWDCNVELLHKTWELGLWALLYVNLEIAGKGTKATFSKVGLVGKIPL